MSKEVETTLILLNTAKQPCDITHNGMDVKDAMDRQPARNSFGDTDWTVWVSLNG